MLDSSRALYAFTGNVTPCPCSLVFLTRKLQTVIYQANRTIYSNGACPLTVPSQSTQQLSLCPQDARFVTTDLLVNNESKRTKTMGDRACWDLTVVSTHRLCGRTYNPPHLPAARKSVTVVLASNSDGSSCASAHRSNSNSVLPRQFERED
jgi:hypothetical protein